MFLKCFHTFLIFVSPTFSLSIFEPSFFLYGFCQFLILYSRSLLNYGSPLVTWIIEVEKQTNSNGKEKTLSTHVPISSRSYISLLVAM